MAKKYFVFSVIVLISFFILLNSCGGRKSANAPVTTQLAEESQLSKKISPDASTTELIKSLIAELKQQINELPDEAFDRGPSQRKKEFENQLNSILNMLDSKNIEGAYNKFWQVITDKMDGCQEGTNAKMILLQIVHIKKLFTCLQTQS
jgi:hypothetical protein